PFGFAPQGSKAGGDPSRPLNPWSAFPRFDLLMRRAFHEPNFAARKTSLTLLRDRPPFLSCSAVARIEFGPPRRGSPRGAPFLFQASDRRWRRAPTRPFRSPNRV